MLEIHEILDRFELLYPNNSDLADLRRLYVDKDMTSLFRLFKDKSVSGNVDDLRKAVLEQNLYSIFRLTQDTEFLRKFILEDNIWTLWPLLKLYVNTNFIDAFKYFLVNEINVDNDCFSRGQLRSKMWLIEIVKDLDLDLGTVYLCAGWYATLATMIFESGIKVDKIRSFDIDPSCVNIAEVFNKPWFKDQWRFKSLTQDIMHINYDEHKWQYWSNENSRMSYPMVDNPNTIINTSCEHIPDFKIWFDRIPDGKLVILQGNDYFEVPEHVNCSKNLEDFSNKAPMSTVLYEGKLNLLKYNRFMKIGIK